MKEELTSSHGNIYSKNKGGRPIQTHKFQVEQDAWQIDVSIISYMSKFGFQDGLTCQDDYEEGLTKRGIENIYSPIKQTMEKMKVYLNKLSHQDIVTFLYFASKSVDIVFCKQYCEFLITVFYSLSTSNVDEIQKISNHFLLGSEIFSFRKFLQVQQKKSSRIAKNKFNILQKKIKQKISINLKNQKKRWKSMGNSHFVSQMEKMKDKFIVSQQFQKLFDQVRTQIIKFVQKPEPFLSQCRIMEQYFMSDM